MPPDNEIIKTAAAHFRQGKASEALVLLEQILQSEPQHLQALVLAGQASFSRGNHQQAATYLERAVTVSLPNADLLANLSAVYLALGRNGDAETQARHSLAINRDHFGAHLNLGLACLNQQRYATAAAELELALQLRPTDLVAMKHFARARYHAGGTHLKVRGLLEKVIARDLEDFESRALLADLYIQTGDIETGIQGFRDLLQPGLTIEPAARSRYHSAMLIALQYLPDSTPAELLTAHGDWASAWRINRLPLAGAAKHKKPRIGWLSPRFAAGPVANFFLPVLAEFDRGDSEHYLYSAFPNQGAMTQRFRSYANAWRDLHGLDAEQVSALIAHDELDILVDLAGHAPGGQLRALSAKPAPVMVSWLDSFCTTGLAEMDYFISDRWLSGPDDEQFFSEKLVRLESGRLCYRPYTDVAPAGKREKHSPIVFACFNRLSKLNEPLLKAWARILQAVPDSRLALRNSLFDDPLARDLFLARCEESGLPHDRVEMHGSCSYADLMEAYRRTDIALDPYPFSGCTSSCDALWMGIPVVTCSGDTLVSRQTAAVLSPLGLDDLVCNSLDDYVGTAVALARDAARLEALRTTLREKMKKQHDPRGFASAMLDQLRILSGPAQG